MIGYIFHSIGFGFGDLLLFVFSILAGGWVARSWRRGSRSRTFRWTTGAAMLIGVDLKKDPAILEPAYDDAQGVTAAFSLNLLARANRELGADFDLEGFRHRELPVFSVQYHPEASPGPHDASYLFDRFVEIMLRSRQKVPV